MYEMYPDGWPTAADPQRPEHERPRRRPRKQHAVRTPVLSGAAQGRQTLQG